MIFDLWSHDLKDISKLVYPKWINISKFKILSFTAMFDFSKLSTKLAFFGHWMKLKILSLDMNNVIEVIFHVTFILPFSLIAL